MEFIYIYIYTFILIYFVFRYIYIRAVSVNALIYAINLAANNALKYFNATLFTSGVFEVVSLL